MPHKIIRYIEAKLSKNTLTAYEKRNYVLNDKNDLVILSKIKLLEKRKLKKEDIETVKLIRSQLKKNWRLLLIQH